MRRIYAGLAVAGIGITGIVATATPVNAAPAASAAVVHCPNLDISLWLQGILPPIQLLCL